MDTRRRSYLEAMGVEVWSLRQTAAGAVRADIPVSEPAVEPVAPCQSVPEPDKTVAASHRSETEPDVAHLDWPELRVRVAACRACELHRTRTQTVVGVGRPDAVLMIIGEAPGADEDRQGEPFVGRAGQLLTAMLQAIGLRRQDVFIANILKCRPPGNRNPSIEEVAACQGYLQRQIELVEPTLILAVGAVSAHNLLGSDEAVGRLRRRVHEYGHERIPVQVTYHPAYLLRRPEEKAKVWADLQKVTAAIG